MWSMSAVWCEPKTLRYLIIYLPPECSWTICVQECVLVSASAVSMSPDASFAVFLHTFYSSNFFERYRNVTFSSLRSTRFKPESPELYLSAFGGSYCSCWMFISLTKSIFFSWTHSNVFVCFFYSEFNRTEWLYQMLYVDTHNQLWFTGLNAHDIFFVVVANLLCF